MDDIEVLGALVELGQHLQVQVRSEVDQFVAAEPLAQRRLECLQRRVRLRGLRREQRHVVPPCATRPLQSVAITRSVPPYAPGGTASYKGATCAILTTTPRSLEGGF